MCWKEKIQWQSVANGLRKEHVLRSPFLDKVLHIQLIILIGNDFNSNSELQITIRKKNDVVPCPKKGT
jgi:hypothetical protein